jgi:hypothetical protein
MLDVKLKCRGSELPSSLTALEQVDVLQESDQNFSFCPTIE